MEYITLNNGLKMPSLGFGTFGLAADGTAKRCVLAALKAGYRHIDTAHGYLNEREVGEAIKESGVAREDIWLTTKIWPTEYGDAEAAVDRALERLGTGYIDLVYLHHALGDIQAGWRGLESAVRHGKVRSIGISNFERNDSYKDILAGFETAPTIAQMERHIAFTPDAYVEDLRSRGIACEAWFPLGGTMSQKAQLNLPEVQQVAKKHGKTGAQVLLRWQLQTGFAAVPGSANEEHIAENLDIFDFTLDELAEQLRSKDILDISQVQYAILETDGDLNAILFPQFRAATAHDLGLTPENTGYPVIIVNDGRVLSDNLKYLGRDESWLRRELKRFGLGSAGDAYLLVADRRGATYCAPMEESK